MIDEITKLKQQLVAAGHFMHEKGWVPATSGNFSARLSNGDIAITISGAHKGKMTVDDIMMINSDGEILPGSEKKPSAETLLHVQIYRHFPNAHCILHPHTIHATVLSRIKKNEICLQDYELLKAFENISTHEYTMKIPVFKNDQNIPRLAASIAKYLDRQIPLSGYIIEGHGFYTWGKSVESCLNQVEALEFLLQCEYMKMASGERE